VSPRTQLLLRLVQQDTDFVVGRLNGGPVHLLLGATSPCERFELKGGDFSLAPHVGQIRGIRSDPILAGPASCVSHCWSAESASICTSETCGIRPLHNRSSALGMSGAYRPGPV